MILKQRICHTRLKYLFVSIFSLSLSVGYAQKQEEETQQEQEQTNRTEQEARSALTDSIDVIRDYRPMLADAVKIRRSPDMKFNRAELDIELRQIAAETYFSLNRFQQAYNDELVKQYPDAAPDNIDNYRISYLAYIAGQYERAASILKTLEKSDAFYQGSLITLGNIAIETNDKEAARDFFSQAMELNFDPTLKEYAFYNYTKVLFELGSELEAQKELQKYINQKYAGKNLDHRSPESPEALAITVLLGTSNYHAGVSMLESLKNRSSETDATYQKATYYRALEYYNERAFENSISMFMRSERYPVDKLIAALATYWKAEAMYEVRKYKEAVESFSRFLRLPAARDTKVYNFALYGLAYAAFRSDSYSTAADYFERFLAAEGSALEEKVRDDVIARLGDSYLTIRNYNRANQYYNQLIDSKSSIQDYALFQRGVIQGLQGDNDSKISTLSSVVEKFPGSNYADDVAFEVPYTYFTMGDYDTAIVGLQEMIKSYPRSSYVPRALVTIGLVQYNEGDSESALASFQKVVEEYATTSEAWQALRSIENIYLDQEDASGYIQYATHANVKNLSPAEQDNMIFQTALSLFSKGQYGPAVEAVNAYFDKFPKPIKEKHARYIRGVSLYHTGKPEEALHDLNIILNDWTSEYTENTLLTAAELYMDLGQYNEAIVHLKKLEIASEFKDNYRYALTNLMICYYEIGDLEQVAKYAELIKDYYRSSDENIATAYLYNARAMLALGDKTAALKELNFAALKSETAVSAEALYQLGQIQYENKQYDKAQKTAFDVINNMEDHEYWVAKSFILLADTYAAQGNKHQAKSTLESIIENYDKDDDIIPLAKKHLQKIK